MDPALPTSPRPVTADSAVELIALTRKYGQGRPAVDAINLRIKSGGHRCLPGPSGCGNNTPLRLIAGHESVSEGDILIEGRNITDLPAAARGTVTTIVPFAVMGVALSLAWALGRRQKQGRPS